MNLFNLPHTTVVNRVIPKNAFDEYTNTKQKRLFTDLVSRITWTHKISPDTVNLAAHEISEVQLFEMELKTRKDIRAILDIVDKAIPYAIIFVVVFNNEAYISLSVKHANPVDENRAVIDWTFESDWFVHTENRYGLQLKKSIDAVFHDFCVQLSGDSRLSDKSLIELVEYKKHVTALKKEIADIQSKMEKCKQFNEKVRLNLILHEKQAELEKRKLL